jgi:hypothetical protein
LIFFEFLISISKCGQNGGRDRSYDGIESGKTIYRSLMK